MMFHHCGMLKKLNAELSNDYWCKNSLKRLICYCICCMVNAQWYYRERSLVTPHLQIFHEFLTSESNVRKRSSSTLNVILPSLCPPSHLINMQTGTSCRSPPFNFTTLHPLTNTTTTTPDPTLA